MAPRYSRPRLVDEQDKQYRAFIDQIMLGKENQRPIRPPRARDLFGGEAEEALRGWLAQRVTLSERRIVEYLEHRGRSAIKKYRELDAVVIPNPKTIHVFEIKASQKAISLRRAAQQLRDTRTILGMLFARVYATVLLVDTGIPKTPEESAEQAALLAVRHANNPYARPIDPPPLLDEVLADMPQLQLISSLEEQPTDPKVFGLLRFSVDDIIALAGAENLHLVWDEDDDEPEDAAEQAEEPQRYSYSSGSDEEEEESPLAAALRKAMKQ